MLVRRARVLAFATLFLSVAPSPTFADPVQPMKNWVLDYADAQCVASRDYGSAADSLVFVIRPSPNGDTYELLLGRKRHGPKFAEELKGGVDFGNGPTKAWLLHYGGEKGPADIYQFRISAAEMAQGRSATAIRLWVNSGLDVTLKLSDMPALLDGLNACTVDLKHYWNMEEPEKAKIATPAKGDLRGIFSDQDYPNEALSRGQQGSTQFLLLIDEKGSVAACHVEKASGIPALDGMGCLVIKERVKFKPALDSQGHPIRSAAVTPPVKWVM